MRQFRRERVARLAALAAVTMSASVLAQNEAGHVDLGGVQLTPVLKTTLVHDDNVFRDSSNARSSDVLTINPSFELKAMSGMSEYSLLLDTTSKQYFSQQDANYTDVVIAGKVHQEFNSRHRLDVNLMAGRLHDANSQGINGRPPEYDKSAADFVYGFGGEEAQARIDVFAGIEQKDYKKVVSTVTNEDKDSSAKNFGSTFYYRVMPQTRALVEIKKRDLTYDNIENAGFEITSYLAGISWDATAKTSGYAKVGRRYRKTEVPGEDTEGFGAWEIGISYQLLPYSLIQLSTSRDFGLETDDPEQSNFTSGSNIQLSWNHDWSDRFSTAMSWSNRDEEIQNNAGRALKDRVANTIDLSMNWKVRRWLTLSTAYSHEKRDEKLTAFSAGQSDNDYKRNIYSVSATVTL